MHRLVAVGHDGDEASGNEQPHHKPLLWLQLWSSQVPLVVWSGKSKGFHLPLLHSSIWIILVQNLHLLWY